jgi:Ca2+-binding RTX toxin-like protein
MANFYGGDTNDWTFANANSGDALYGGGGNDVLMAAMYTNILGNGTIGTPYFYPVETVTSGIIGGNNIYGGEGRDAVYGWPGADRLFGGDGNDSGTMQGNLGLYYVAGLFGGDGNDYLDGGGGDDWMYGGSENDIFIANSGVDTIYGGAGEDTIYGGRYVVATDRIVAEGNAGNDVMIAGDYIDVLYGDDAAGTQTGSDLLWAGGGSDYLIGGNGADTLIGNYGSDYYYGGAGSDYFDLVYDVNAGDVDYLQDFTPGVDYVLLKYDNRNDVTFGVSAGYAYGYIAEAGGTYYLFLAPGLTAAQLQAATFYI